MGQKKRVVVVPLKTECRACGETFETFALPDFLYGQRLLYSANGQAVAWVSLADDPAFAEVSILVDELAREEGISEPATVELFNRALAVVCDPVFGCFIDGTKGQVCPKCGSSDIKQFALYPNITVEIEFHAVTHEAWSSISIDSKRQRLRESIL